MANHIDDEEAIFCKALEVSSRTERSAFLATSCGDDRQLRDRLEELLAAHDTDDAFLQTPPVVETEPRQPAVPGTLIGRYKLLELIGEGGFGDVYMAEQQEPVHRKVALKIIKLGMDTRAVIARFEAERQALAMMDHPNVAKILDAGIVGPVCRTRPDTPDAVDRNREQPRSEPDHERDPIRQMGPTGRPYFVMELIRGIPITEYCDENKLTTEKRLRLFTDVCRAVQHAHQKGIIHRDIKPTNVLVTQQDGKPVSKIIDFGIAKATQQRLTEKTLFTAHHQLIGTPEYMSPEQATFCEMDVDTRSDIYSLGVLLYELLVGTTPFDAESLRCSGYDEICRTIRETDPPTPSKRSSTLGDAVNDISNCRDVGPVGLERALRGDLDWIVMKALEKDRSRRYETANDLVSDIERHLIDDPVHARPPSKVYRLKKFFRKHRGPVTAAVFMMAALFGGMIVATAGFLAATRQQDATRRQLYVSDMNSAYHAWEDGNVDRALALLSRHIPQRDDEDLRGFEWRYLWEQHQTTLAIPTLKHGEITSIAFSPDGTTLASAAYDSRVMLWDAATLEEIRTLQYETGVFVLSVAFSPDGKILACGSRDRTVRLWDVSTGNLIATLNHNQEVRSVAFTPDGETLAAGCGRFISGDIKLWNVATRAETNTFSGHSAGVYSLSFSPDGKTLASGSRDRSIRLWDVATGAAVATLRGHRNKVHAVAFSLDGSFLASGGRDGIVKLWKLETRTVAAELSESIGAVNSLQFSPSGTSLAIAGTGSRLWLWDPATRHVETYFTGHSAQVSSVAFSPDGTTVATGSRDGTVKIADVSHSTAAGVDQGHGDWLTRIAVCPSNSKVLAVGSGETATEAASGEIVLYDLETLDKRVISSDSTGPINSIALSPDGQVLAAGESRAKPLTGVLKLWDVKSGRPLHRLEGHTGPVSALAFSPDGTTLASGDWGRTDVGTPESGDWGATIRLWDVTTGEMRKSLRTERFVGTSMEFSPDGKCLAIGGGRWGGGEINLWNVASDKKPAALIGPSHMVWGVAFSPDGKTLASADWAGGVELWDVASGTQTMAVDAHNDGAISVAFSSDGKTLASGGRDRTVRLWHVATAGELATLKTHVQISSVAFLPDGNMLAAGGMDKSVTLWPVNTEKEVLRPERE